MCICKYEISEEILNSSYIYIKNVAIQSIIIDGKCKIFSLKKQIYILSFNFHFFFLWLA